jgi:molecular chaperone GrpE
MNKEDMKKNISSTAENQSKKSQKDFKKDSKSVDIKDKVIEDLKIKLKEAEEKLLRELAENENLRKRHEKEIQDNFKYAIKNFAYDLLPVTDNFQRAVNSVSKDEVEKNKVLKNLVLGLQAVEKEIHEIFDKNGVKQFDSMNQKFNPEIHQAVSKIISESPEGVIIEELQKGFNIGDRLLRSAMVIVSSGKGKE